MMDKISGTTGWGMEPSISSDGLLSMLFESGEGFATAFDSALLATEPMETEGALVSPESEMQDGLELMESEWNAVVMPGLTPVDVTQSASRVASSQMLVSTSTEDGQDTITGEMAEMSGALDTAAFTGAEGEPNSSLMGQPALESTEVSPLDSVDFSQSSQHVQVAAATPSSSKSVSGMKTGAPSRVERAAPSQGDTVIGDETVDTNRAVTQADDTADTGDEATQEWDSSHLQLEGEFEPLAANSPFPKQAMPQTMDPRMVVESDTLDIVENDGSMELNGTQTKGAASKTAEPQVAFEEEFENPSDALVDLSEQRTVRVVVDQELAVEVSQDGDAVDVMVEGAQDVTDNIRESAAEIAESLEDSGMHLRDFTARKDGSEQKQAQNPTSRQSSTSDVVDTGDVVDSAPIPRGQSVNIVA